MAVAIVRRQPQPDLATEIHRIRDEIDAFIDRKATELKNSPDGASQPIQTLRHMITRGDSCLCRAGLRLLEQSNG